MKIAGVGGLEERLHETDRLAVLGRLSLIAAIIALFAASVWRPPRLIYSYHLQHFAAFYVVSLCAAIALKRTRVVSLGCGLATFAILYECLRSLSPFRANATYLDWVADAGGVLCALTPILAQKFRARF